MVSQAPAGAFSENLMNLKIFALGKSGRETRASVPLLCPESFGFFNVSTMDFLKSNL